MDESTQDNGYFVAGELDLGPAPSPWLRLAHHHAYVAVRDGKAAIRHILDHEFIIQDTGDSWLAFPDQAGSTPLPQGSVALILPGLVHGQAFTRSSHHAIHFDLRPDPTLTADAMVRPHGQTTARSVREVRPLVRVVDLDHAHECPLVARPDDFRWWRDRARRLVDLWTAGRHRQPGERIRCAAILAEMVHAFCYATAAVDATHERDARVSRALAECDACDRALQIPDLAERANLGETAFRASVVRLTGVTPRLWLEQRRCERAVVLLQNSPLSVREIASACGYDDPYHFSRVIRRRLGRSPSQIRYRSE